jgi:3',5'-nucleoside bisphosphate phosphatase
MLIDLQVHSNYSDGYLTPTELAGFLANHKVKVASLTDHNAVNGQAEFRTACRQYGIKAVTGLELYVRLKSQSFNILWFNFDEQSDELHKMLSDSQGRRRGKARKILTKLTEIGFNIEVEDVLSTCPNYIPVNRLVDSIMSDNKNRELAKKQIGLENPRESDVIKEYFYNKELGRFHNSLIDFERVLKLRKKIGGQLVLNHPGKFGFYRRPFLSRLSEGGIDAIEVLSPHHSIGAVTYAQALAKEFGWIMTGGSDFHRFERSIGPIEDSWQYFKIDSQHLNRIDEIIS